MFRINRARWLLVLPNKRGEKTVIHFLLKGLDTPIEN